MRYFSSILFTLAAFAPLNLVKAEVLNTIPDEIDPGRYYLFYLHGQIVEGSDGRPIHPEYGTYRYPEILESLSGEGFVVISEIRRKNTDPAGYASLIAFYISQLKKAGVPSSHITVAGGSKGGIIACHTSNALKDKELNFVIMAGFFDRLKDDPNMEVYGRILAIHDSADPNGINPRYFLRKSRKGVTQDRVVITKNGWGHGLIYEPRKAWIDEVVRWSGIPQKGESRN